MRELIDNEKMIRTIRRISHEIIEKEFISAKPFIKRALGFITLKRTLKKGF